LFGWNGWYTEYVKAQTENQLETMSREFARKAGEAKPAIYLRRGSIAFLDLLESLENAP
jgi:hypothetical protein